MAPGKEGSEALHPLEIIVLRGLPGSGKTTWARAWQAEHPQYVRINRDDLRAMLHTGTYIPTNEVLTMRARDALIVQALLCGRCVIIDDTNLHTYHIETIRALALPLGVSVRVVSIDTPLEECIARDALRPHPVGETRIREMVAQLTTTRATG